MTLTILGLALATIGSVLLGWSMIEPHIWLTRKQRYDAKLTAVLEAAQKGDNLYPGDDAKATEYANKFRNLYLEDLKRRTTRKIGIIGVAFLGLGFVF